MDAATQKRTAIDRWVDRHAVKLDKATYAVRSQQEERLLAIDGSLAGARIVFLGETNHFIHEKVDFRLWWLRRLAAHRKLVACEELGWSDGRDVARYLADGDESHLDRLATFGDRSHMRADRDDAPTGILRASFDAYPTELYKAEQVRFYRGLRALGVRRFFGCDIDAPGSGYGDLLLQQTETASRGVPATFWSLLERVTGESIAEEVDRLMRARAELRADRSEELAPLLEDLDSLIETLRYTALAHPADSYAALAPAMAYRETTLKRRVDGILEDLADDEILVLMAHAFHLAKDDHGIGPVAGVGPGGGQVSSLGHHLVLTSERPVRSIWLIYGEGEDSQPFPDLPKTTNYPASSLNTQLARAGTPMVLPVAPAARDALADPIGLGHMYNLVVPVHVPAEADLLFFLPRVSPLRP